MSAAALSTMVLAALSFPVLGEDFYAILAPSTVGDMFVEVYVAPDGEADECTVLYSDFRSRIDDRICNQIRQNDVASPAYDQHGDAVYGTAIYRFTTTLGNRSQIEPVLRREPVLEIGISQLPDDVDDQLVVGLRVLIDGDGRIEICEPIARPADAYSRIACDQIMQHAHPVRSDREGNPTRHVTDLNVVFTMD